jgi:hypothetical protein
VTSSFAVALLTLALVPTTVPAPRLPTVAVAERIPLPRGLVVRSWSTEALQATIELRPARDAAQLAARIAAAGSRICPEATIAEGRVILHCRSPRIDADLVESGGARFLDLFELRGLPWREASDRVAVVYDPQRTGLGAACPGDNPSSRGECLLAAGNRERAIEELRKSLETPNRAHAAVRLGDIALAAGDAATAAGWYGKVRVAGPFGKLAASRLCELGGGCLSTTLEATFETAGMPEPIATELRLRGARAAAFLNRPREVSSALLRVLGGGQAGVCERASPVFCRRLIHFALATPAPEGGLEALDAFLSLPGRSRGPMAAELARAAAERAALLGAPVFAGNVLAAAAPEVRVEDLPAYLLRASELYLFGGDWPRAAVVLDYAEARLPRQKVAGTRWMSVRKEVARFREDDQANTDALSEQDRLFAEASAEIARAVGVLARARTEGP